MFCDPGLWSLFPLAPPIIFESNNIPCYNPQMNLERLFYNAVGIRNESDSVKWYSVAAFEVFSGLDRFLHKTVYEGSLPSEGTALVVSMHTSAWDMAKGYTIVKETAHKLMRGVARESLLDPDLEESQDVLERTGKLDDSFNKLPKPIRQVFASFIKGIDPIGVKRGAKTLGAFRPTLRAISETFSQDRMVGIFTHETRRRENDLKNLMEGPAFIARLHHDIPIYPVAIWSRDIPHRLTVGAPFSAKEAFQHLDFRTDLDQTTALTLFIAERITEIADCRVKVSWDAEDRRLYLLEKNTSN